MKTKLVEKQENFLQLYVKNFNITRAYREAYITTKSDEAASANGARLIATDKVKKRLAEILKERNERVGVDSAYVINYLMGAVELDLDDFAKIGKDGVEIKEFKKIPKAIRKYCTEVNMSETKRGTVMVNFKIFSKEKALEMLAKHTGATIQRVELSGNLTLNSITDLVNGHSED